MVSPLVPGDPGYDSLLKAYKAQGGGPVSDGRFTFVAIQDVINGQDVIKFVVQGQVGTFDKMYESRINQPQSMSVPMQEPDGQLEITQPKPRRSRKSTSS